MTRLVLKRAKFWRPSGQWQDEDYDQMGTQRGIGRMSAREANRTGWGWRDSPRFY